jgi:hypothetical protein
MSALSAVIPNHTRLRRGGTVLAAAVAGLIAWTVASPLLDIDLSVAGGSGSQQVGPGSVVLATLVSGVLGWVLLALLERRAANKNSRIRINWTITGIAVLAVSLGGPLRAVHPGTTIALLCLHLIVGGVLVFGLRLTTPAATRR